MSSRSTVSRFIFLSKSPLRLRNPGSGVGEGIRNNNNNDDDDDDYRKRTRIRAEGYDWPGAAQKLFKRRWGVFRSHRSSTSSALTLSITPGLTADWSETRKIRGEE